MSERTPAWTPYGLEAIRIARIRRQRILAALLLIGIVGALMMVGQSTTTKSTEIFVNGQNQNTISIDKPEAPKNKPVTVSLSPGRVTQADTSGEQNAGDTPRASAPILNRAAPYNWTFFLFVFGPWILIALALWALGKHRGKHDQVNYGIYKGAMPLEMISMTAQQEIFTKRHAKMSIFGKRREDYLTPEVLRADPTVEGSS